MRKRALLFAQIFVLIIIIALLISRSNPSYHSICPSPNSFGLCFLLFSVLFSLIQIHTPAISAAINFFSGIVSYDNFLCVCPVARPSARFSFDQYLTSSPPSPPPLSLSPPPPTERPHCLLSPCMFILFVSSLKRKSG